MARRWLVIVAAALIAIAGARYVTAWTADRHPAGNVPISTTDRYSKRSFESWLAAEPDRAAAFSAFEAFLDDAAVSGVVPNWQLLRTDTNNQIGCPRPAFLLPPRDKWRNIVAPLRLLKGSIIPAIGPVEVVSSYRTAEFNGCVNGASKSRHLDFAAIDLVTITERDNRRLFAELCRVHGKLGPASRFGLGAYFDPAKEATNRRGRFHVDAAGHRTWGFTKTASSSGCRMFNVK